jgi:hypothetical protein
MFEIGIFCVILFAIGYWTTLFIMGRREDVLHGQFVEADAATEGAPISVSPVPTRPREPLAIAPVAVEAPAFETAAVAPAAPPVAAAVPPPLPPVPAPAMPPLRPSNPEKLQLLLASLKQELKNAAQI